MYPIDEKILIRYLQGDCSAEELKVLSEWLEKSQENRDTLFRLQLTLDLPKMSEFEEEKFLDSAEKKLMEKIGRREEYRRNQARKRRSQNLALRWAGAAVLAVALIGSVLIVRNNLIYEDIVITVSPGNPVKEILLPDGSKVWLNQSSKLKYTKAFGEAKREMYLDGEAYFEVIKAEEPFIVSSPSIRTSVLGTTFNMKAAGNCKKAEVTLIEGSVEVKGNRNEGQIVLSPGQRAEVDLIAARLTVHNVNAKLDGVWRNNNIPFNEANLHEIALTLEQFYDISIIFSKDVDMKSTYSGVIRKKDSIKEVLDLLKNSIPIVYSINGRNIHISAAK